MREKTEHSAPYILAALLLAGAAASIVLNSWHWAIAAGAIVGALWLLIQRSALKNGGRRAHGSLDSSDSEKSLSEVFDAGLKKHGAALASALAGIEAEQGRSRRQLAEAESAILAELQAFSETEVGAADVHAALKNLRSALDKTKRQITRVEKKHNQTYGLLDSLEGRLITRIDDFRDDSKREAYRSRTQLSMLMSEIERTQGFGSNVAIDSSDAPADSEERQLKYSYYLSYQIPREVEAIQQLYQMYSPGLPAPLLGGWALGPTGTLDVINVIRNHPEPVVVECGSGTSTMWLAYAIRDLGAGHVYSLEHDPVFAERTRQLLADHGLEEYVTVLDAPISEHVVDGESIQWYEISDIQCLEQIDVLIIDGPPQALGDLRNGAIRLLGDKLSQDAHIFIDDVNRPAERADVAAWLEAYPDLQRDLSSATVQAHLSRQPARPE